MMVWLLVLPGGLAVLLLVELGIRLGIAMRGRYYPWFPHWRLEFELDREVFPRLDPLVRFHVNGDGERGSKVPTAGKDLYRVLAVGGSAVECFSIDQEATWPMKIQRTLEKPGNLEILRVRRVHVGNIGKSSVDAEALEVMLKKMRRQLPHLDLIIVMVGASNVLNWLANKQIDARSMVAEFFKLHPENTFQWNIDSLALTRVYRSTRARFEVVRRKKVGSSTANARRMRANASEILNSTAHPSEMLAGFEEHFAKVAEIALACADRVIVVPQPWFQKDSLLPEEIAQFWNGGAGDVFHGEVTGFYSHEVVCTLMSTIEESTIRIAKSQHVEVVEVRGQMQPSINTYYDQFHFTPLACDKFARVVAGQILHRPTGHRGSLNDLPS
jgi:hypothetical protein